MSTYGKLSALPEQQRNELLAQVQSTTVSVLQAQFDDMLDDGFGEVTIGGYKYSHSTAFLRVDPIAYSHEFMNWIDAQDDVFEFDGGYYNADEVETLLGQLT
jgi:hypothetical protein